jgi:hypothetical protein
MSPPIRDGSGSSIGSIRLGDGTEISEVRTGAGDVLFSAIPASGVSRWEFEQDVGDSWDGNNGTDNTSAGFSTDSQVGSYSKDFDGSNDYITIPYDASLFPVNGEFSVSQWIKTSRNNGYIVYARNGFDSDEGWATSVGVFTTDKFAFNLDDGSTFNALDSSTSVTDGSWHHVVCTWNPSEPDQRIYVDGSLDATATPSLGSIDPANTQDLFFGRQQPSTKREYGGLLDDVKYYDKELTNTEVSNLYNNDSIN